MTQRTITAATPGTRGGRKLRADTHFELYLVEDYGGYTVQSGDTLSAPPGLSSTGASYPAPTGGPSSMEALYPAAHPNGGKSSKGKSKGKKTKSQGKGSAHKGKGSPPSADNGCTDHNNDATEAPHPASTGGPDVTAAPYPSPTGISPGATEAPYPSPSGVLDVTAAPNPSPTVISPGATEAPQPASTREPDVTAAPNPSPTARPGATEAPQPASTGGPGATEAPYPAPSGVPGATEAPFPAPSGGPGATEAPNPSPTAIPGATEAPYPAPTDISPGATKAPDGGDGSLPSLTLDCAAVRAGEAPTNGPSTELDARLDIAFYKDQVKAEFVRESVYNVMNDYVRLWMLGCDEASVRRLQEARMVNAVMEETREDGTCESDIAGAACLSLYTPTTAIHTGGDTSGFQDKLDNATQKAINDGLFAFDGVVQVNIPGEDGWTDPDATPAGATSSAQEDHGLDLAGQLTIAATAVALLLLALLLIKRQRSTQDKNIVMQLNSTSTDFLLDNGENKTFVVGDSDSVGNEVNDDSVDNSLPSTLSSLGGAHAGMDVHVCQSSLCAACMKTKQNGGISFVQVEAPSSLSRIPDDAVRAYSSSDTVTL